MSQDDPKPAASTMDSFASLFEGEGGVVPPRQRRQLKVGDRVQGKVVLVGTDSVFVEIDGMREAYLEANELRGPDGTLGVAVGDTIAAHVLETDEGTGQVRLGRSMGKSSGSAALEMSKASQLPIEGKVTAVNKGGLEVDIGGTRAFCPMKQIDVEFVKEPGEFVGKTLEFVVIEIKDGGKSVVVSRRIVLERAAAEQRASAIASGASGEAQVEVKDVGALSDAAKKDAGPAIVVGAVLDGVIDRIETFGVFVQLAGTKGRAGRGLVPVGELGVPRGTDLRKAFPLGTKVTTQVIEIGVGKEGERRIRLSLKAAKDSEERAQFEEVRGKVGAPATLGTLGDLFNKKKR
jgi:small subunit ribosomal protein S1